MLALVWLLLPAATWADGSLHVDARTGRLSVVHIDSPAHAQTGAPALRRSYNALSRSRGVFGMGWGSVFDIRLISFSDNTAAVRDANGLVTWYGKAGGASLTRDSQRIAERVAQRENLAPSARDYLVLKLNTSPELRVQKTLEHGLPNVMLTQDTLATQACSTGQLQTMGTFYSRSTCDGWQERFDLDGRLQWRGKPGAPACTLLRDAGGVLTLRTSDPPFSLRLTPGDNGFVAQALVSGGTPRIYTHDALGNLMAVEGMDGPVRYEYAPDHLLTAIHHPDGRVQRFEYRMDRRVVKLTLASGEVLRYDYTRGDNEERNVERTVITQHGADGMRLHDKTVEQVWDARSGRLLRHRDAHGWHRFEYTDQLRLAYSSFGDAALAFDATGLVTQLEIRLPDENTVENLRIHYGADQLPVRIHLLGRGAIAVQRNAAGELDAVQAGISVADIRLASRVMQLLSVFRRIVRHSMVEKVL